MSEGTLIGNHGRITSASGTRLSLHDLGEAFAVNWVGDQGLAQI